MYNLKCDIILPVCDQFDFTKNCIESIIKYTDTPFKLIVINNGKNEKTRAFLEGLKKKNIIEVEVVYNSHNIGWVKALNMGMGMSSAPYLCFQNDDTIVTKSWLRKMINILEKDEQFGLINPAWEGRKNSQSIDQYNSMLEKTFSGQFIETDWCRGFSVVLKRKVMEIAGKVDEIYGLAYFDDVDYSVTAISKGFIPLVALDTYVYHHRNVTFFQVLRGQRWNQLHEKNKKIYYKKWGKPLKFVFIIEENQVRNEKTLSSFLNTVYATARNQHRIHVLSSSLQLKEKIKHTNILFHFCPQFILNIYSGIKLLLNGMKKKDKRYSACFVFEDNKPGVPLSGLSKIPVYFKEETGYEFVIKKINELKEKTKEGIDAEL